MPTQLKPPGFYFHCNTTLNVMLLQTDRSLISSIHRSKRLNLKTSTKSSRLQNDHVRNTDGSKPEVFFGGATAQGGPWPPLQYASRPLDPLLCLSIRLFPSFWGPWTRHPTISFLVFLFVLLHTAFRTSFSELRCLAFFLCDQAIVFFAI